MVSLSSSEFSDLTLSLDREMVSENPDEKTKRKVNHSEPTAIVIWPIGQLTKAVGDKVTRPPFFNGFRLSFTIDLVFDWPLRSITVYRICLSPLVLIISSPF